MAIALYRRYRPETFAEMIGQAQVTDPLMTALRSGSVGHAYLFSGPRGCGKTTSARVLARCLNCAEGPTDTPCGSCQSCVDLSRDGGGSLDVIEIDAASHGGVDDARDLRERAIFAPVRDRYKIFIIDEAHMVSPSGFNALLKIVEEPPEHVKFVFATTEPEKVIGTIRSRTHHYPFRLIAPAPLMEYVQGLCDEEGVSIAEGVLPLVIRAGGGSARDTLSILDQLIAGSEDSHITYERAVGLLGYTHEDLLDDVVNAIAAQDAAEGIQHVDRVIQTGQDPRRFVEDLLERLRDLIIVRAVDVDGAMAVLRGTPEDQIQRLYDQAAHFDAATLSRIADLVRDTLDGMTGATAPRLHLELMMARIFVAATAQPASASPAQAPAAAPAGASSAAPAQPSAPEPVGAFTVQGTQPDDAEPPVAHPPAPAPEQKSAPTRPPAPTGEPSSAGTQAKSTAAILRDARAMLQGTSGHASAAPHPARAEPDAASPPETAPAQQEPQVTLDTAELKRMWPELVHQLRTSNPEAGETAERTLAIGLDGAQLTLGFTEAELLESFKTLCAGPIRELISQRYGVRVTYLPRVGAERIAEAQQLFGGSATRAIPAQHLVQPQPPVPQTPPAQAPAEPPADAQPEPEPMPEPPPEDPSEPPAPPYEPPAPETHIPEPGPASVEETHDPQPASPSGAPEYVRYGESVVRERLGATFLEEQPLPGHTDPPRQA